ncbi:alanine racemase [Paramesorhizobium deserti]|uniref:Alanine racemase n=1 Tax=Paramesorhizobium deserti TaxID=1494590 RepID=A0A135HTL0_9HYPH|nr:LacI family DNA-binding transcriptional regulator [Paramesorhizobium deserti]KXF76537.1 alanine racemase [Paramesorhizobium deserti]
MTKKIGKRATIRDVAKAAGVSIKTVSRVFNDEPNVRDEIREKVRQVGQQLSYHPNVAARNLARRRSHLIGLFFENPSPAYVTELQMGALKRLRGTGYRLLIFPVEDRADIRGAMVSTVYASGLDGVIVTPPMCDDPVILEELLASHLPFVRVAGDTSVHGTGSVVIDDEAAAFDLAEYVLRLGHRRVAIVIGDETHRSARLRLMGFRRALQAAGIEPEPAMEIQGAFTFQSGLEAGRRLLHHANRPTAILASNDDMAAGVLQAAHELRIPVPQKLSIVGFDDTALAQMVWPQLTTIRQPIFEMAERAADILLKQIEKGVASETAKLSYDLVIRSSAGEAPTG